MNNLNSILIEGNMVRDPQYRTHKGMQICTFCIATNRYFQLEGSLEREVSFFDVETQGRLAEACNKQGKKGRGVRVVGRLRQDRWHGEDGKLHARITISAKHVEFCPELKEQKQIADKNAEQYAELDEIGQDVLPDEEMTDESRVVEIAEAVA